MKYIDIIEKESNIDFKNNPITVNGVHRGGNLLNKSVKIEVTFDHPLKYEEYNNFHKLNQFIFIKKMNFDKCVLCINYKKNNIIASEAVLYLKKALAHLIINRKSMMAFADINITFENNEYIFNVDKDSMCLQGEANLIKDELKKCGFNYEFKFRVDSTLKPISEITNENIKNDINKFNEVKTVKIVENKKSEKLKFYKRKFKIDVEEISKIKDIPYNQEGLITYTERVGQPHFRIQGSIFKKDISKKKHNYLAKLNVYDGTDSILVNKWLRDDEVELFSNLTIDDVVDIVGKAEFSFYERSVVIQVDHMSCIGKVEKKEIIDKAKKKRIELQVHTKMTNLDGINSAKDYINTAIKWGMKSMAFTDTSGIYEIPEILHNMPKDADFKPIYGVQLPFINDLDYKIAFTDESIDLKSATYVVYDLETTGLSQEFDEIIEVAMVKVKGGVIIDSKDFYVNPRRHIPEVITNLTSITDDDVKDALFIEDIMPKFIEYTKDCILVAHNAAFDIGMIYDKMERLNIKKINYPVIDTLSLFQACYNQDVLGSDGAKKFNLEALAKFFKVNEKHHHRADDDTRVTAEAFIFMLNDLYKKKIYNYKDINSVIDESNYFKYKIPSSINVLVKNQVGFKNLYKLLSDSLTIHCHKDARLLKSVLNRFREGLIVYEGSYRSNVFELALNRSENELRDEIKYLDFVAVQPPMAYYHLFYDVPNGVERIKKVINKILKIAKEEGKIVCATSNCHYIDPNDKKYRDILIASPLIGGGIHPLSRYKEHPDAHLRTTDEMLNEFDFLDEKIREEIVIDNTIKIADSIEKINVFPKDNPDKNEIAMKAPRDDQFSESLGVPSIVEDMKKIVYSSLDKYYGKNVHPIVKKRLDREMNSIISAGYSSTYYMAHLLVKKSVNDGYMVGSRGSVGSSLVATMMDITEINPLPPHYRCPHCKFHVLKMSDEEKKLYGVSDKEKPFMKELDKVLSGYDLPDMVCPICGEPLVKDGHDIPFETFLGFNGDKVPDIDLNFSSEYQAQAHAYIKEVFGVTHSFRAGTLATIADKNAYGYVKAYFEKRHIPKRDSEIDRISQKIIGVKRSTGQHPGGIVVVPKYFDIFSITPIQYASNNTTNEWMTTHYDYHSFEDNLLKLDCLGHDDPTMIRYFMDYVNAHQDKYSFEKPQDIPIDDKRVYQMFGGTDILKLDSRVIDSKVASYAVPEFGTNFVRQMLNDTMPNTFAQLVKISGLSHGTNVWLNNAQELVLGTSENGKVPFADVIGCRDDVMLDLINMGCEPSEAFSIMEFVRKNKKAKNPAKWEKYKAYMREKNVPEWYIWSCEKIEYLFPKAHATAYVLMALRIAWFKLYSPALFYSGWFSKRAKAWDVEGFLKSPEMISQEISMLSDKTGKTAKDDDLITSLQVAREMRARNLKFLPVDINESDALIFKVVDDQTLRMPFIAVDGLGESAAISIQKAREEKDFTSIDDVMKRSRLNKTLKSFFKQINAFGNLPEHDEKKLEGLFDFL